MKPKKKLLIIEPHSDDSIIAIGGFLSKFKDEYEIDFCLVCASDLEMYHGFVSREDRLKEYEAYVNHFSGQWLRPSDNKFELPLDQESKLDLVPKSKLVRLVEMAIIDSRPDTLMFMGPSFHHDHTLVYEAVIAAVRPTFSWSPSEVCVLENPTYVNKGSYNRDISVNAYIELSEEEVDKKNELFLALFPSQARSEGNYLSPKGLKKWAQYRGMEARCDFAEAYYQHFVRRK